MILPPSILQDFILLLPLFIANAALLPIMRRKMLGKLHARDFQLSEWAFGKNKTALGLALTIAIPAFGYWLLLGSPLILPGIGMAFGTHASSFIKRRLGKSESSPLPLLDQLDFFAGGVLGLALSGIFLSNLLLMAAFTACIHLLSNMIAFKAGLKDVWW
ncbi:MAG: CDP-archaeol synthase [Candidatus Micrarchaeota archaeon]|nr:CDP-archaeol synthase [Candidatus Micrarchaeota archaeon]